VLYVLLGRAVT